MKRFFPLWAVVLVVFLAVVGLLSLRAGAQQREAAERYLRAVAAAQQSLSELSQAENLAAAYARSGITDDRDRCKASTEVGAAALEEVHQSTPEDGDLQAQCREGEQAYELVCAQIVLSIEARQKGRVDRAAQLVSSKTAADADREFRATVSAMQSDAARDAAAFWAKASRAVAVAVLCGAVIAAFVLGQAIVSGLGRRAAGG